VRKPRNKKVCPKVKKVQNFRGKKNSSGWERQYTQSLDVVKDNKTKRFRYKCKKKERVLTHKWNFEDLVKKYGDNPTCYISGDPIDYDATADYHLDHILPRCRGGDNSLENCGLATKTANQMKWKMTLPELLMECKKILEHNGYSVTKGKK